MRKIKDRIFLGTICGIIAAFIGRAINATEYRLGLTDVKYNQIASTLFLPKRKKNTIEGRILGSIINNINVSIVGTIICYVLSISGRDKASVKSMGIAATTWVMINGLTANLGLKIKSHKPLYPFLTLSDHLIYFF